MLINKWIGDKIIPELFGISGFEAMLRHQFDLENRLIKLEGGKSIEWKDFLISIGTIHETAKENCTIINV